MVIFDFVLLVAKIPETSVVQLLLVGGACWGGLRGYEGCGMCGEMPDIAGRMPALPGASRFFMGFGGIGKQGVLLWGWGSRVGGAGFRRGRQKRHARARVLP